MCFITMMSVITILRLACKHTISILTVYENGFLNEADALCPRFRKDLYFSLSSLVSSLVKDNLSIFFSYFYILELGISKDEGCLNHCFNHFLATF